MNWTLYELLLNVYQGFLFTWFVRRMLTPALIDKKPWGYIICSILTACALSSYIFFPMPKWDTWIFIFIIAYSLFFFTGNILNKLFWDMILIIFSMSVIGISYQCVNLILGADTASMLEHSIPRIVFTSFTNILLFLVLFAITRFFYEKTVKLQPLYLLLITDFLCIVLIDIFFILKNEYNIPLKWLSIGCVVSFIIGITTIITNKIVIKYAQKEQEYRYRESLLKDTGTQIEDLQNMYDSMKKLRHDMHAYVRDIQKMIDTGELLEKPDYLQQMESQVEPLYSTGNLTLDSVFSVKIPKIRQANIEFRGTNLHYTGGMNITDIALSSLISNMIDNAIEALILRKDQPGERYIYLQFSYSPAGLMIICENPLLEVFPENKDEKFLSQKPNDYHGLGISIMKKIVSDSQGQFDIALTKDVFRVLVLIPPSIK